MVKLAGVGRLAVVAESPLPNPRILNYRHIIPGIQSPPDRVEISRLNRKLSNIGTKRGIQSWIFNDSVVHSEIVEWRSTEGV
jgi:hypothetical protein